MPEPHHHAVLRGDAPRRRRRCSGGAGAGAGAGRGAEGRRGRARARREGGAPGASAPGAAARIATRDERRGETRAREDNWLGKRRRLRDVKSDSRRSFRDVRSTSSLTSESSSRPFFVGLIELRSIALRASLALPRARRPSHRRSTRGRTHTASPRPRSSEGARRVERVETRPRSERRTQRDGASRLGPPPRRPAGEAGPRGPRLPPSPRRIETRVASTATRRARATGVEREPRSFPPPRVGAARSRGRALRARTPRAKLMTPDDASSPPSPGPQNAKQLDECVKQIAETRPDLEYFAPDEVTIRWNERLGEGGFCTAYRATWRGAHDPREEPGCIFPSPGATRASREGKNARPSRTAVYFSSIFPPPGAKLTPTPPRPQTAPRPPDRRRGRGVRPRRRHQPRVVRRLGGGHRRRYEREPRRAEAARSTTRRGGRADFWLRHQHVTREGRTRRFPSLLPLPEKDTFPVAAPLLPPSAHPPRSTPSRSRDAPLRSGLPPIAVGVHGYTSAPRPRGDGDGDGDGRERPPAASNAPPRSSASRWSRSSARTATSRTSWPARAPPSPPR